MNSRFSAELSTAIATSGMSLSAITDELSMRGHSITGATLSYWKNGRSLPKRASSHQIVRELERILNLATGTLITPLEQDLRSEGLTRQANELVPSKGTPPQYVEVNDTARWEELDSIINWDSDVRREVLSETVTIHADYLSGTREVTSLVRIPQNPHPSFHVAIGLNAWDCPPRNGYIELKNITGATISHIHASQGGMNTVTRLDLPRDANPGELCRVSFTYSFATTRPLTESCERAFSWPLRFYIAQTRFEGPEPTNISYVQTHSTKSGLATKRVISTTFLSLDNHTVQVARENVQPCTGIIRWDVPSELVTSPAHKQVTAS